MFNNKCWSAGEDVSGGGLSVRALDQSKLRSGEFTALSLFSNVSEPIDQTPLLQISFSVAWRSD